MDDLTCGSFTCPHACFQGSNDKYVDTTQTNKGVSEGGEVGGGWMEVSLDRIDG